MAADLVFVAAALVWERSHASHDKALSLIPPPVRSRPGLFTVFSSGHSRTLLKAPSPPLGSFLIIVGFVFGPCLEILVALVPVFALN